MDRRCFLRGLTGGLVSLALRREAALAGGSDKRILPEYAGSLDEFLFVYDQCSATHLLREMIEIVRHAPTGARVHVLVSRALADRARERLASFGLDGVNMVISDEDGVSGDWGRDIFQLGIGESGVRVLGVPWFKAARSRNGLDRGWRQLRALERENLAVTLIPAAFEGGNLMADVLGGRNIVFAGSTIAVETRELYRFYYDSDPGDDGVARILAEGLGADRVVWLGPRKEGELSRQSRYGFHIDMGMTLVSPQVAVVARCDITRLAEEDHRTLLQEEAARTMTALTRREALGWEWPEDLELPRDDAHRKRFLETRLHREQQGLLEVTAEWDGMADQLLRLGFEVHRIEADPLRVRRFQSHTNAIVTSDRLLMPLFPSQEHVHGWLLNSEGGRDRIDMELGLSDSEFDLVGDNLEAYRLFQKIHPGVRVVRDYFYLASGNVHCVVGRMS